jgi:hypothetical protein
MYVMPIVAPSLVLNVTTEHDTRDRQVAEQAKIDCKPSKR